MFENYYVAKKYYNGMVRCLNVYRALSKQIIEIQQQIEDEDYIKALKNIARAQNMTLEDVKEGYRNLIRHIEKDKCRRERQFRERYGVQTSKELEAKIREFEPELERLKPW